MIRKIVAYALKVISGEFPDTDFHHRKFLGQRHWRIISTLDSRDKVIIPRKFPPWSKTEYHPNKAAKEFLEYANQEKNYCYTLDDYLEKIPEILDGDRQWGHQMMEEKRKGGVIFSSGTAAWYEYATSVDKWRYYEVKATPLTPGGNLPATSHDWSQYDGSIDVTESFDINKIRFLEIWLLTPEDIEDPLTKSPEELKSFLKTEIPVEVLNDRLKKYVAKEPYELVGGWEKEI